MNHDQRSTAPEPASLASRTLTVAKIVIATLAVGTILVLGADVILLLFAGILVAVLLRSISHWIAEHTPLTDGWSLGFTTASLLGLFGLSSYLLATPLTAVMMVLTQKLYVEEVLEPQTSQCYPPTTRDT